MGRLMLLFTDMVEANYEAAIAVLCVFVVSVILGWLKAPRKYICILWMLPFVRLILPFQLETSWSLIPKEPPAVIMEMKDNAAGLCGILSYVNDWEKTSAYPMDGTEHIWIEGQGEIGLSNNETYLRNNETYRNNNVAQNSEMHLQNNGAQTDEANGSLVMNRDGEEGNAPMIVDAVIVQKGSEGLLKGLTFLWFAGIGAGVLYSFLSYIKLKRKLKTAVQEEKQIYLVDGITSPFVLCGFRSRIYLPSDMDESMKEYVIAHEKEHIKRKDPILKIAAYLICLIHWMNPLIWLAYLLLGKEMELACDEAVIMDKDGVYRKEYAKTLLSFSIGKPKMKAVPLAFAEGNPKDRVEKVATYKKPVTWVAVIGLLCIGFLAVILLTNPKKGGTGDVVRAPEEYFDDKVLETYPVMVNVKEDMKEDRVRLYYADQNKILFGGKIGLFSFDRETEKITASLDWERSGWQEKTEEIPVDVKASYNGKYLYFQGSMDGEKEKAIYAFDTTSGQMYLVEKPWEELDFFENLIEKVDEETGEIYFEEVFYEEDGRMMRTSLQMPLFHEGKALGSVKYHDSIDDENGYRVYEKYGYLFMEGRYADAIPFQPEDIKNIVSAEMIAQGEVISWDDEETIKWVEENFQLINAEVQKAGSGCPFYDPLYIRRKDGALGYIYPSTDSCTMFKTEDCQYYDYTIGTSKDNAEFQKHFVEWFEGERGNTPDSGDTEDGGQSGATEGVDTNRTQILVGVPIYTQDEIQEAIDVATKYFEKNFDGCTLKTIYYKGNGAASEYKEWAKQYDADEAIVLLSSFEVDESGGDGSLEPNSTYEGWNWILVRDSGGKWRHVDHGY